MDIKINDVLDMILKKIEFYKNNNRRIKKIEVIDTGNSLEFKVTSL